MTNEGLQRVKEERNNLQTIKRRNANWTCHVLRRVHLLHHVFLRKDRRKNRNDGKTRKTSAAIG